MLTLTSAKRIILLLISLNVVTILTVVTIFSSGMHIANANTPSEQATCTTNGQQLARLTLNGIYQGNLLNSSSANLAKIAITFQTNTKHVPHTLSIPNFQDLKPATKAPSAKKGGGAPMDLADGTGVGKDFGSEKVTLFTVTTQDKQTPANPVIIQFQVTGGDVQTITGAWAVTNTGSMYDKFAGTFTLSKS